MVLLIREDLIRSWVPSPHLISGSQPPLIGNKAGSTRVLLRPQHARHHPIKVFEHLAVVVTTPISIRVPSARRIPPRNSTEPPTPRLIHRSGQTTLTNAEGLRPESYIPMSHQVQHFF